MLIFGLAKQSGNGIDTRLVLQHRRSPIRTLCHGLPMRANPKSNFQVAGDAPLQVAHGLLALHRGHDELLLANNIELRPLYVKEWRRYILEFLKAAGELQTYAKIIAAYPHEAKLMDVMLDYGIIVPHKDGKRILPPGKALGESPSGKKMRMSLYLLLSQSCNMACVYCLDGRKSYQTNRNLKMGREVAFRSVERCLEEVAEGGLLEVLFFGGEPLLNWPLAKEVILHCEKLLGEEHKGKRRLYHFTSNLSFLPNDLIEWARKYDISFLCDIDGPPEIHNRCRPFRNGGGTHEATTRTIQQMCRAGLKIDLRATITSVNQDHLPETAQHHKDLGGYSSGFVPVVPVNSDESILPEELLPSPEKVIGGMTDVYRSKVWKTGELVPFNQYASRFRPGCPTVVGCGAACGIVPAVCANGDVYPCIYLVGIRRFHLGNIMNADYPKRELLERLYDELHVDHLEDCRQCSWRYICGGSCPLGRLTVSNNPLASAGVKTYCRKIRCDFSKSVLELLLWEKADETVSGCHEDPVPEPRCA